MVELVICRECMCGSELTNLDIDGVDSDLSRPTFSIVQCFP
jgi:hypothetical protein